MSRRKTTLANTKFNKGISVFLIIVGMVIIAAGFFIASNKKKEVERCTAQTTGIVTSNKVEKIKKKSRKRTTTSKIYRPVFTYEVDGISYEGIGENGQNPPKYQVGDEIKVHYDPDDPKTYYVTDTSRTTRISMSICGGVFTIVGAVMLTYIKKNGKSTEQGDT